jgi:phosphoglycerate dehydrogenase-like enzyme
VGFEVVGYDPFVERVADVETLALEELLRQSRFVTLHVPLNDAIRGMIGAPQLALMPAGSFLINAARGGVVDEAALLAALDSGHLAGAALDVRVLEPPGAGDPFANRPDVLLTAHLAGLTQQSQAAIAVHVLAGVRRALES